MPAWYTFLEDNSGGFSMMRACLALVVLAVMLNWSYINYTKKEIAPLPDNAVTLIAALAGAKVIQRYGEKGGEAEVGGDPSTTPVNVGTSVPLTVTVQGSVPIQGTVPISQVTVSPSPAPVVNPVVSVTPTPVVPTTVIPTPVVPTPAPAPVVPPVSPQPAVITIPQ